MAAEKRRQVAEQSRANRQKAAEEVAAQESEENSVLDDLLEKLRNGENVGRKARRMRPSAAVRPTASVAPSTDVLLGSASGTASDTADIAKGMLARLKSDGFDTTPLASTGGTRPHRRVRRGSSHAAALSEEAELSTGEYSTSPDDRDALNEGSTVGAFVQGPELDNDIMDVVF